MRETLFTRRAFLTTVGAVSVASAAPSRHSVSYVASADSIDVYRRGEMIQRVPSDHPFLELDARRKLLFAANQISEYAGLPRGSVESYGIESGSGRLSLLSCQPLSLSATMPRGLAIAPDGRHLVVAVYGGGAYNVFPIHKNGELDAVTQIVKEIGSGRDSEKQASAHPHSVLFDHSGKSLIGTDLGSDRINIFRFEDGHLTRAHRVEAPAGSGPAELWFSGDWSVLSVRHQLRPAIAKFRFNADTGQLAYHRYS